MPPLQYSTDTQPPILRKHVWTPRKRPIDILQTTWWSRIDSELGRGWTDHLPADAREIARATRQQLQDAGHEAPQEEPSPEAVKAATQQSKYLRASCRKLFQRFSRGKALVKDITSRCYTQAQHVTSLRQEATSILYQIEMADEFPKQYGDQQEHMAQAILADQKAHRNYVNHSSRCRKRCWKALVKAEQLAISVTQVLAQIHWYDELEREHGDNWRHFANENIQQWNANWERSSPQGFPHMRCLVALATGIKISQFTRQSLDKWKWYAALEQEHGQDWGLVAEKARYHWSLFGKLRGGHLPWSSVAGQSDAVTATAQADAPSPAVKRHPEAETTTGLESKQEPELVQV